MTSGRRSPAVHSSRKLARRSPHPRRSRPDRRPTRSKAALIQVHRARCRDLIRLYDLIITDESRKSVAPPNALRRNWPNRAIAWLVLGEQPARMRDRADVRDLMGAGPGDIGESPPDSGGWDEFHRLADRPHPAPALARHPRAGRGGPGDLGPLRGPAALAGPPSSGQPHPPPGGRAGHPPEHVRQLLPRPARGQRLARQPAGAVEAAGADRAVQGRQHGQAPPRRPPRRPPRIAPRPVGPTPRASSPAGCSITSTARSPAPTRSSPPSRSSSGCSMGSPTTSAGSSSGSSTAIRTPRSPSCSTAPSGAWS